LKNLKKILALLLLILLVGSVFSAIIVNLAMGAAYGATSDITIVLDGKTLTSDTPAFIYEGRTMVPIRVISESMGYKVEWDGSDSSVSIFNSENGVLLRVDNRFVVYQDGAGSTYKESYSICDVAPMISDSRTYVPLRLVANAMFCSVNWDSSTRTVYIESGKSTSRSGFFSISINGISENETITGKKSLSISGKLPSGASTVKYYLMNTSLGKGTIIGSGKANGSITWLPRCEIGGTYVVAAKVFDSSGNFLSAAVCPVKLAVNPQVSLKGVTDGSTITGTTSLSVSVNFEASGIKYMFINEKDGKTSTTAVADPYGDYSYTPTSAANGTYTIKPVAYDANGNEYTGEGVSVNIAVSSSSSTSGDPVIKLKSFKTDNVGKVPVTLSITRNFDVIRTMYMAKNTKTGAEVVLEEKQYGDYVWFPGPDMAGTWEVYVACISTKNNRFVSNSIKVNIGNTESLIVKGIAANQVITGKVSMSAYCNTEISSIYYEISNPKNNTTATIGEANDATTQISWTPSSVNEGYRYIQAIATKPNGDIIKSEKVKVHVFLGTPYSPKAICTKDEFIDIVKSYAIAEQKKSGMSAALQVAQAILESGWGQSVPVDRYTGQVSFNLFGIKGTGTAGFITCTTKEEYLGVMYTVDGSFRAYNNVAESWADHTKVLNYSRYADYRAVMYNYTQGAYALKRCGYATDSSYPAKLINIINTYGLGSLDLQVL